MNRVEFNCYDDLVGVMQTLLKYRADDEYKVIAVYGHFAVIKKLLEELIIYGETIDGRIDLETYEYSDYNKEFTLYLTEDGIAVEKAWCDECKPPHYLDSGADVAFVHEDCNSKLLEHIESNVIYEFGLTEPDDNDECECCQCCADCDVCGCDDEESEGCKDLADSSNNEVAAKSQGQYFVNGKEVAKEEYEEHRKEFDKKMKEFMDFWNPWDRVFFRW